MHGFDDELRRGKVFGIVAIAVRQTEQQVHHDLHLEKTPALVEATGLRHIIVEEDVRLNIALFINLRHLFILSNTFGSRKEGQTGEVARYNFKLFLAFVTICFVFWGAVAFSLSRARNDQRAARAAAAAFYARLSVRDFSGARAMLTRERQDALSEQTLERTWNGFEARHGQLRKWELASLPTVYGNRVSIFPRYVEEARLLSGTRGKPGAGMLHLQPEDGQWKVGRLSIVP